MSLFIEIVPAFQDNYIFVLTCSDTGEMAVVDPGDAGPVLDFLNGRSVSKILNTHHHADHVGGNSQLVGRFGCEVHAGVHDKHRIPSLTHAHKEGDVVTVGKCSAVVLDIPGHTLGHIAYYFEREKVVFVGDTLFVGGCGRLFEGSSEDMFNSLVKLKSLPDDVEVYCAHEYTVSNFTFALSYNECEVFERRLLEADAMRNKGVPTVPTTIGEEKHSNIFIMSENVEDFTKVRQAKDEF